MKRTLSLFAISFLAFSASSAFPADSQLGIFETQTSVGDAKAGDVRYFPNNDIYRIRGNGANIWAEADAFEFVSKRIEGDLVMTADIEWPYPGSHEHRKAGWMVRQSLDADEPYVDAVIHGNGLISLQYRETKGGPTAEIQSPFPGPRRLRFERRGDVFSLEVADDSGAFRPVGSISIALEDPVHAGLAVCSHNADTQETALFRNVELEKLGTVALNDRVVESTLEIVDIETKERRIVYRATRHFEAPNWSPDGAHLVFNSGGRLYRIPVEGGEPQPIDTGEADRCNNDHGFSPDGKQLAISSGHEGTSLIYIVPAGGGTPRKVTENGPSYWHGWSPDGKTLAYCASRDDEYDVYTIPVEGGDETRLTDAAGLDDGPDYSPDGRWIYFNSVRTGKMAVWRMRTDGSNPQQMTSGQEHNDWFPHPSPDGKQVVFLSYGPDVQGHPANRNVSLRAMPLDGGTPEVVAQFFGGQGTINVPSWSPDSTRVAFVSYRLIGP